MENYQEINANSVKKKYKIVVVGSNAVGKTTLLRNISDQTLEKNYIPTLGVNVSNIDFKFKSKNSPIETSVSISVWDIAGQFFTRNLPIHKKFYNGASAAILVYDLTRDLTYKDVPEWRETVDKNVGNILPILLIGNKVDLKDERVVSIEKGNEMAGKLRCPYIETSALTGENVKESFKKIAALLLEKKYNI